jgi:hypothetical protein
MSDTQAAERAKQWLQEWVDCDPSWHLTQALVQFAADAERRGLELAAEYCQRQRTLYQDILDGGHHADTNIHAAACDGLLETLSRLFTEWANEVQQEAPYEDL